ncbi:MAG: hypothetical protein QXG10_03235 [Candidatus Hadarchaeales archaeon]
MEFVEISGSGREAFLRAVEEVKKGCIVVLPRADISLDEEVMLKQLSEESGGLVLGPGCGSSMVLGKGFGVWSSVRRGPFGLISTGGSGILELTSLLRDAGISHSICVGPRDLSQKVGARGTSMALKFFSSDPETDFIIIAARTPTSGVLKKVLNDVNDCSKPVILCLLGAEKLQKPNVTPNFEACALKALALGGYDTGRLEDNLDVNGIAMKERFRFGYGQRYLRGLFSGGMLCTEAQLVTCERLFSVRSNFPVFPRMRLPDPHSSRGHACVDMGDPEISGGGNPMVDLKPRCDRILREAGDWEIAVLLLDVVLGNGAHPDPAGELARSIEQARSKVQESGGNLCAVASVIGTKSDPQGHSSQIKKLMRAETYVLECSTSAARLAASVAGSVRSV